MQVTRLDFLEKLNNLKAAVASSEIVEQSTSFIFEGDRIIAFDDEVAIQVAQGGLKIKGAVEAGELLTYLNKSRAEELDVSTKEDEMILKARNSEVGIRYQSEILIDVSEIPSPDKIKWKSLPKNFRSALHTCIFSTSSNINTPALTCIRFKGDYASSCDTYRATLFRLSSTFKNDLLLPAPVARIIERMDLEKYSSGKGWVHFLTKDSFMVSARTFVSDFPEVEEFVKMKGEKIEAPKEISDILDRAGIFAKADLKKDELVKIRIEKNWCQVRSANDKGWIKEKTRVKYKGKKIIFQVNPDYMREILKLTDTMTIGSDALLFKTEEFDHVISLFPNEDE
jgi:hypothetical protein